MDSRTFLGLSASHNLFRWSMPITPAVSTWRGFMWGGCGLGAAISAMEDTSGRECVWATAQYLSYAKRGEVMDIDVTLAAEGSTFTQARAVCHVGNREILTVNGALGERPVNVRGQWETMPDVEPPDRYQQREFGMPIVGTIHERLEQRMVKGRTNDQLDGTHSDGRVLMWARIPDVIEGVDASALAVLGDFVPLAVGQALGKRGGGNSLDNTLRVVHLVSTDWALLDIRIQAVERGAAHGLIHMFAEDGTLLATASQTCSVRVWDGDDLPPMSTEGTTR